jgi:hypothetical protein
MKATNLRILSILMFFLFTICDQEDEILQVILLFRNGSRFPQFGSIYKHLNEDIKANLNFPKEMSDNQIDSILRDQLTGNGIRQIYLLAKKILSESVYKDFLKNEIKEESDVYALASNKKKTLDSAQILLFSLLGDQRQPKTNAEDYNTIYHRPRYTWDDQFISKMETPLPNGTYNFPVHSVNKDKNKIFLAYQTNTCNAFFNFGENLVQSDNKPLKSLNTDIIKKYPDLKTILNELDESGLLEEPTHGEIKSAIALYYFTDYLESMRKIGVQFIKDKDGKEVDDWLNLLKISDFYKSLYFFEQKAMTVQLNYLIQDMRSKIKSMYFNKQINYPASSNEKNHLDTKAEDQISKSFHKFVAYAGHDINLWAFLNNFGLTSSECLRNKLVDTDLPLEDAKCQGNVEFSENLSFVLRRPKPPKDQPSDDNVYIGKGSHFV